jgi:hypothetical protein
MRATPNSGFQETTRGLLIPLESGLLTVRGYESNGNSLYRPGGAELR